MSPVGGSTATRAPRGILCAALLSGCGPVAAPSTLPPLGAPYVPEPAPALHTDRMVAGRVPVADVLWIVDDSPGMEEEQLGVGQALPGWVDFLVDAEVDVHLGVVTTDMDAPDRAGRLREVDGLRWVQADTPDASLVFGSMFAVGTRGSETERGRDAAMAALVDHAGPGGANEGFERAEAALHVVVLSDESDFSTQVGLTEFRDFLATRKADPAQVSFSALVLPPGDACPTAATPGDDYWWLAAELGGVGWSVCDADWGAALDQLAVHVSGLQREFFLSRLPDPNSLEVWVEDGGETVSVERGADWVYDPRHNSVRFVGYVPGARAEVVARYALLAELRANR